MLCDRRAAPLRQEDAFVREHGTVTGPSWPVPSPPPPAIKRVRGRLQLPPSLGSTGLAPPGPGMAPHAPGAAPASSRARRGRDGPTRAGARGLSPCQVWCHGAGEAMQTQTRAAGWAPPRASIKAGAVPPLLGRFSSQPGRVGSLRADLGLGPHPEAAGAARWWPGRDLGLPCGAAECTHRPVPAREGGPEGRALPAPARTGRKDKTQTCSAKDPSLY